MTDDTILMYILFKKWDPTVSILFVTNFLELNVYLPFCKEPSYTVGGNVNWCSHCGEQYGGSSKNYE